MERIIPFCAWQLSGDQIFFVGLHTKHGQNEDSWLNSMIGMLSCCCSGLCSMKTCINSQPSCPPTCLEVCRVRSRRKRCSAVCRTLETLSRVTASISLLSCCMFCCTLLLAADLRRKTLNPIECLTFFFREEQAMCLLGRKRAKSTVETCVVNKVEFLQWSGCLEMGEKDISTYMGWNKCRPAGVWV